MAARRSARTFDPSGSPPVFRPPLLFLGDTLPYPPDRPGVVRSFHWLRVLASHYDVDALLFQRRKDPTQMPLHARLAHLRKLARVELFRVPQEWSAGRRAKDRALSRLTGQALSRFRYARRDYALRALELLVERDPRVVHVDRITLSEYLEPLEGRPAVLSHDRVESEHLRQMADRTTGRQARNLARQADLMEEVERHWLPRLTLNVVRSERDREALLALAPGARVEVWPDGVDTRHFSPAPVTGKGLVYVGGLTNPGDRDALEHFAADILPRLRRSIGLNALEPITWVGAATERDRRRYGELGIDLTGYVEDIRPLVQPAACFIVPARLPGTARFKVLPAWAMGKAVVTTAAGCDGLEAVDGENLLVRDDPADFARAVADVLEDRALRARLGRAGRSTAEARYAWDHLGPAMLRRYQALEARS